MSDKIKIKIDTKKLKLVERGKRIGKHLQQAKLDASEEFVSEFKKKLEDAVTRRDLSIKDLYRLDHPYAVRHGSIQIGGGSLKPYMVHYRPNRVRGGAFKDGFKFSTKGSNQFQTQISVYHKKEEDYHRYIFEGTSIMLPRNPIAGVHSQMKRERRSYRLYMKHINRALKRAFKK